MPVETSADRMAMIADFGVTATYTPFGGTPVSVMGIFDNAYEDVSAGGTVGFAVLQPRFFCRSEDISAAQEDDTLVVGGVSYTIAVVMPDGTGMTSLMLEAV